MDGNEHSLADIGKFPEEPHRIESGLTIQSRCWLVKENEDRGLGYELDANCHSLALFDGKTRPNPANQCVLEIVELKKVDYGIDISQLLFSRCIATLTKKCRELERLSNGAECFVNIELFAVTGRSLERYRKRTAVNQNLSVDSTFGFSLG
jgi:hypothetical protein